MKGEINMTKWTNNDGEIFEDEDIQKISAIGKSLMPTL